MKMGMEGKHTQSHFRIYFTNIFVCFSCSLFASVFSSSGGWQPKCTVVPEGWHCLWNSPHPPCFCWQSTSCRSSTPITWQGVRNTEKKQFCESCYFLVSLENTSFLSNPVKDFYFPPPAMIRQWEITGFKQLKFTVQLLVPPLIAKS